MSACTPHPQVMSPCSDDAVSVAQVLGTRGDRNFDESGSLALTIGQTSVAVTFDYEKESSDYRFEQLYIKAEDAAPVDIRPVVNSQTKQGFTAELTGVPITVNCKLYWRVIVPDSLHTCQTVAGGPKYAIVPTPQSGIAPFPIGTYVVTVVFPVAQPDTTWEFEALSIEAAPTDPATDPQTFSMPTVTSRLATGFQLMFSGAPDTADRYTIHWRIA